MITARDEQRLIGVHPVLVTAYHVAAAEAERQGTPIFVVGGVRTPEFQRSLWRQGREIPGPNATLAKPLGLIVTEKDGYTAKSDHQPEADGFGHAIDFAFVPTKQRPDAFAQEWPWSKVAAIATQAAPRVQWGGTWKTPRDLDHLQLV